MVYVFFNLNQNMSLKYLLLNGGENKLNLTKEFYFFQIKLLNFDWNKIFRQTLTSLRKEIFSPI